MPSLLMDGPQEAAGDMTDENITRKFRTPAQSYVYFVTVSLAVCLLVALGTIMILVFQMMVSDFLLFSLGLLSLLLPAESTAEGKSSSFIFSGLQKPKSIPG